MNVSNWNFFYKKEEISIKERIVDTMSLWGAIGLLWWSFCNILEEVFPMFLAYSAQTEEQGLVTMQTVHMDGWLVFLWMIVLWISYDFPEKYVKNHGLLVRGLALMIPLGYAIWHYEKITKGMIAILEVYMPYFNNYNHTSYSMHGGVPEHMPVACTFAAMVLWLCCWLLAYGFKRKIFLAVFPLFALGLELAVGLSPIGMGLLVWFAAIVLLLLEGSSFVAKGLALASVVLSFWGASAVFGEEIDVLATKEQKQAVLDFQEDLKNFNLADLLHVNLYWNKERLGNETPEYTGEVVFKIDVDKLPHAAIYLRGFYGTDYENHAWKYDSKVLANTAKVAGDIPENTPEHLFQITYEQMKNLEGMVSGIEDWVVEYQIQYLGMTSNMVYTPYASNIHSLDEEYRFSGDFLVKKAFWDEMVEVQSIAQGELSYLNVRILSLGIDRWIREIDEEYKLVGGGGVPAIDLGEYREELEWYNMLSQEYLEVPEGMDVITKAAEDIRTLMESWDVTYQDIRDNGEQFDIMDAALSSTLIDYDDPYMQYSTNSEYGDSLENCRRYSIAAEVRSYLAKEMSYSLLLDDLPTGADPIEYALTESHEGYCMHFASAATLILRELGIPARYVSGYVVWPNMFQSTLDGISAEVTDYSAHAWVEIWLDYIGWIPIEVTPGYFAGYGSTNSDSILPTQKDPQELESESDEHREEAEATEDTEIPTESESEDTENVSEDTEQTDSTEDTEDSEKRPGFGWGGDGAGMDISAISSVIGTLAAVGLLLFVAVRSFCHWKKHYHVLLEQDMQKKHTRKAVKRMNRRIYVLIQFKHFGKCKGFLRRKQLSDSAYETLLKEIFTGVSESDWTEYMRIAKKMHYSLEEISYEEMMHCYQCYVGISKFHA